MITMNNAGMTSLKCRTSHAYVDEVAGTVVTIDRCGLRMFQTDPVLQSRVDVYQGQLSEVKRTRTVMVEGKLVKVTMSCEGLAIDDVPLMSIDDFYREITLARVAIKPMRIIFLITSRLPHLIFHIDPDAQVLYDVTFCPDVILTCHVMDRFLVTTTRHELAVTMVTRRTPPRRLQLVGEATSARVVSASAMDQNPYVTCSTDHVGEVVVYDVSKMKQVLRFVAHKHAISSLSCNNEGDLLASASVYGTLVRVFALPIGRLLFECRVSFPPDCCGVWRRLRFSSDSVFLAVATTTSFKFYKLKETSGACVERRNTWSDYFQLLPCFVDYTPNFVRKIILEEYAVCDVTSMTSSLRVFSLHRRLNDLYCGQGDGGYQLMVITDEGLIRFFDLPTVRGETCKLRNQGLIRRSTA